MSPEPSLPGGAAWIFWYTGELAFKWVPGIIVALAGGQQSSAAPTPTPAPVITEPVSVVDIVRFMQLNAAPGLYDQLYYNWTLLVAFSIALSLILATILIYSVTRTFQIRQAEYKHYLAISKSVASKDVPQTQLRWDRILEQADSESDQARRVAILEADIMLGELLDTLGYRGETIADRMRQVQRTNFNTIDMAWEAHRARNKIAHEAGHVLSPHEARRVIGLYDKVFREFGFLG